MKKIKIGLIILSLFISINIVKADETNYIIQTNRNNENFDFTDAYELINSESYNYYAIVYINGVNSVLDYYNIVFWNEEDSITYEKAENGYIALNNNDFKVYNSNDNFTNENENNAFNIFASGYYLLYDSNYNLESTYNFELTGFYQDNIVINIGDRMPLYKDLIQYNSWSDYENNHLEGYTEVNLDNYEYVLLSLKDYNQTEAFQTNLQIKGQVGITPIYNFGQTSKDAVTGVQVQDRCNLNYSEYTSYPFYIIQSDLQNNAIYAVKECSENSSFKFDNTVFDITYITQENEENPTVTIDGKTYNVIPYDELPSTATKNEEDNYIPGESGSATDTGGIDSAIKNVQESLSQMWNTFSYFTDFVGQLFSSLPSEIRTVLLSAFIVGIVIGLIKLFVS